MQVHGHNRYYFVAFQGQSPLYSNRKALNAVFSDAFTLKNLPYKNEDNSWIYACPNIVQDIYKGVFRYVYVIMWTKLFNIYMSSTALLFIILQLVFVKKSSFVYIVGGKVFKLVHYNLHSLFFSHDKVFVSLSFSGVGRPLDS